MAHAPKTASAAHKKHPINISNEEKRVHRMVLALLKLGLRQIFQHNTKYNRPEYYAGIMLA